MAAVLLGEIIVDVLAHPAEALEQAGGQHAHHVLITALLEAHFLADLVLRLEPFHVDAERVFLECQLHDIFRQKLALDALVSDKQALVGLHLGIVNLGRLEDQTNGWVER